MNKLVALRKTFTLGVALLAGTFLGPIFQKKPSEDPIEIAQRIEENVSIIRQYVDQENGIGYFDELMRQHENDFEFLDMIKTYKNQA